MRHNRPHLRTYRTGFGLAVGTLSSFVALTLGGHTAWADSCTPPANGPTGSDAPAFTYQCDGAYAGKWTSAYYVYDPVSAAESPLYTPDYSYDCTQNVWTQSEWDYDAASGTYTKNWVAATTTPSQPTNCAGTGASVDNTVDSSAQSGDAVVANNSSAGNATSGNSAAEVTQTNLVQTTSNTSGNTTTFTTNIGDMNGDLVLDPSSILPAGTGSGTSPTGALSATTTDASLTNTITATAASGNATVSGNGDAGNATSGDAQAIINLINMINSAVAAGQSFIGTINIYGDFNGNILIPQSVIDQLLGSNADTAGSGTDPNLTSNTNESIVNNITAAAQSGDATVTDNGQAGNATSGNANTHVTVLNLTGSSIVGKNVLLVFVNVLGKWVGMIMNAPTGATSAEFGGGVSSATTSTGGNNDPSALTASTSLSITNNVTATAQSGDATVTNNDNAGNATSGDADVAVNILNMEDSELSLANWFGILFINVFGTWNGSFGILPTPAPAAPSDSPAPTTAPVVTTAVATTTTHHHSNGHFAAFLPGPQTNDTSSNGDSEAILGAMTTAAKSPHSTLPTPDNGKHVNLVVSIIGLCAAGAILLGSERKLFHRHKAE